jgi:hypothetical protein
VRDVYPTSQRRGLNASHVIAKSVSKEVETGLSKTMTFTQEQGACLRGARSKRATQAAEQQMSVKAREAQFCLNDIFKKKL